MPDLRRQIPTPELQRESLPLRFSFKHLDFSHERFPIGACNLAFMECLLKQLRIFSTWPVEHFTDQNNRERRHIIDFDQTCERNGFSNVDPDQLGAHESWQFSVCPDDPENCGRVHGILIDDTFFVVWLDPLHRLFPQDRARDC